MMIPNMPSLDVVLEQLLELTTNAGEDALEAMNIFYSASIWCCRSSSAKGFFFDFFFAYVASRIHNTESQSVTRDCRFASIET
jgi:hypothetical protein